MNGKLVISSSPHVRTIQSVQSIMIDVLIALGPVALVAVLLFGKQALITMAVGMGAAMLTEALWLRRWNIFGDGSAAVTGLLLAMTLPANVPWWIPVIGAAAAIIIGKQLYGGIGQNIFNPALVGRAILVFSWGSRLSGKIWPVPKPFHFFADISAVTTATPGGRSRGHGGIAEPASYRQHGRLPGRNLGHSPYFRSLLALLQGPH